MKIIVFFVIFLISFNKLAFENTQEKQEVLRFFWNENNSILDIQTHTYIRNIAQEILKTDYDFFIIDDNSVNAFATEYGLIGINKCLINLSDSESEMASVVAHEIAHIKLHHFDRFKAKNKYNDLLVIGGVLLGGLSKNSEITNALISSSLAGSLQLKVNFTRSHEVEADNYGKKLLEKSRFDNFAMSDFFAKLKDNENAIEYTQTHPLSKNRVVNSFEEKRAKPIKNSFEYLILKSKFNADFDTKNKELKKYNNSLKEFAKGNYQNVINILKAPKESASKILKSRAFARLKKLKESLQILDENNLLHNYFKAEAYFLNAKYNQAKAILKEQNYPNPSVYNFELLAKINLKQGDNDKYYYNTGKSLILQGKIEQAKQQFILAKNNTQNQDLFDILTYKISKFQN
jgi:predicted Zn-dependent protease